MSLTKDTDPVRWGRYCLVDGGSFSYCGAVGMGEFIVRRWPITPETGNELISINVQADPNGLIESIDTFPTGQLYDPGNSAGSIVTVDLSQTVSAAGPNSTPIYKYTPAVATGAGHNIIGLWTFVIEGMQVTLKTGDTCQVNFRQIFNGGVGPIAYSLTTTKQTNFSIYQADEYAFVNWGDGSNYEFFESPLVAGDFTHTYDASGTYTVYVHSDADDITWLQSTNQQLQGQIDLTGLPSLTTFDIKDNTDVTSVLNPTNTDTWVTYRVENTGISSLDVSTLSGLGGVFKVAQSSSLTDITFPASSTGTFTLVWLDQCDLGYVDMTGCIFSSAITLLMGDNGMTTAEVNHMLVDFDNTFPGTGTGGVLMAGTNAAPDGSAGGYDGTTAKANLIANGYSITTT